MFLSKQPRKVIAVCGLALTVACVGRATPKVVGDGPVGSDGRSAADIHDQWIDPEAPLPRPSEKPATGQAAVQNPNAPVIAIRNATLLTAAGKTIKGGTVVLKGGAIASLGDGTTAVPAGALEIDGTGKFVTPGLIDPHSHIGLYPAPSVSANQEGNETTSPVTPQVSAAHAFHPQDPAITRARAGGVTTALVTPGSTNLFGGIAFVVVMRPGRTVEDVRFPGAPRSMKMACGENPKRYMVDKGGPATRMGLYAQFRAELRKAREYGAKRAGYRHRRAEWLAKRDRAFEQAKSGNRARIKPEPAPESPAVDAGLENLAALLRGEIIPQVHCYKASDMHEMLSIADELGFRIRAFHHAVEAYKLRDILAEKGVATVTWDDWWGFKMESFDGIPENAALVTEGGARATMHSDSAIAIQRLNQMAAKAMYAGRRAGIDISEDQALRWITANPAWVLGIDHLTGTLEPGKRADVVVWNAHPFSVYASAEIVIQGGAVAYRLADGIKPTDFELGNSALDEGGVR